MSEPQTIKSQIQSVTANNTNAQHFSWLCIRLSHLALNINKSRANDLHKPLVVSDGEYVWQCNAAAANLGVNTDMSINQMQLMTQHSQHIPRDRVLENRALNQLAQWAIQFTPNVCLYNESTLLLNVGGSLRLFDGVKNITARAQKALEEMAFDCKIRIASTPKAAYLMSLNLKSTAASGDLADVLATPLSLLQASSRTIKELDRCGFTTLNDIADISLLELGSRFGSEFVQYLEQTVGSQPDPQIWIVPPDVFETSTDFAQPISNSSWIEQHQKDMLHELITYSNRHNLIYQHISWSIKLEGDKPPSQVTIELNAKGLFTLSDDKQCQALYDLTALKQEKLDLKNQITGITLGCSAFAAASLFSRDLFNDDNHDQEFQNLRNKLIAKLGHRAVVQLETRPEIAPEDQSVVVSESTEASYDTDTDFSDQHAEPIWVYERPKPLSIKNSKPFYRGELEFIHGANRIVSHWWSKIKSRDYYIARQQDGQILWIYYDRVSKQWFLHGLFA